MDGLNGNLSKARVDDFDMNEFGEFILCAAFRGALRARTTVVCWTDSGEMVADPPRCGVRIRGADEDETRPRSNRQES